MRPLGQGHINQTFHYQTHRGEFVIQKLNGTVFPRLKELAQNVELVLSHLQTHGYPLHLIPNKKGHRHTWDGPHLWRVWPYLAGRTLNNVSKQSEAKAAGEAFGKFAQYLEGLPANLLHRHMPRFHDLAWRFEQLETAQHEASAQRLSAAQPILEELFGHRGFMVSWQHKVLSKLPERVAHFDAKLSNVLLDLNQDRSLAVLDLDTVMPGTVLYDYGDLLRSATCPETEDSILWDRIKVNPSWHQALTEAFFENFPNLSEPEKLALPMSGAYLTLLMAVRFLTDFLAGDRYYATARPQHNLDRARNQTILLRSQWPK